MGTKKGGKMRYWGATLLWLGTFGATLVMKYVSGDVGPAIALCLLGTIVSTVVTIAITFKNANEEQEQPKNRE